MTCTDYSYFMLCLVYRKRWQWLARSFERESQQGADALSRLSYDTVMQRLHEVGCCSLFMYLVPYSTYLHLYMCMCWLYSVLMLFLLGSLQWTLDKTRRQTTVSMLVWW